MFQARNKTCGRREVVAGFKNNAEWCKCKHGWVRFFTGLIDRITHN